jgi:hypothetical protein
MDASTESIDQSNLDDVNHGIWEAFKSQWRDPRKKAFFLTKIAIVVTAFCSITFNSIFNLILPQTKPVCFEDKIHAFFDGLTSRIEANNSLRDFFIVSSSLLLDVETIALLVYFVVFFKSNRIIISYLMFFTLRFIVQVNNFLN